MRLLPSAAFVKASLASHSWLGLLAGALMYLVCLSGTVAVFYPEFERWEQPDVPESRSFDAAAVERAYHDIAADPARVTHHMFVSLPAEDMPRTSISNERQGWFVNDDGSLGPALSHDWTDMLTDLHLYLHLPATFGMVLVSALGALLVGLIMSGLMAHPRIFKDAFLLRLGGSRHLEQADIHNRLSVWGAPFHLIIAITGAYFGLAALVSWVVAAAYFEGDTDALSAAVFGAEPALHQPPEPIGIARALTSLAGIAPDAEPFYLTVEDAGTPEQYMIVGARHAGRLIYAEQYRFDASGTYLDKVGYSDGEPGRQAIFSVYRLHFGHFGGPAVKLLYGVLGFALTVVSVTGVNVWLARRRGRDWLNDIWTGLVWGTPVALAVTAIARVLLGMPATGVFWLVVAGTTAWAATVKDEGHSKRVLQVAAGGGLLLLAAGHGLRFQMDALGGAALGVNGAIVATAITLLWLGMAGSKVAGRAAGAAPRTAGS